MPALTGMTLREALQILSEWQLAIEIEGSGVVVRQTPPAGKKMTEKGAVKLICRPS